MTDLSKLTKRRHGCFSDSLAYILGMRTKDVPLFIKRKRWLAAVQRWLKKRGYEIRWIRYKKIHLNNKHRLYIVAGQSPRSRSKRLGGEYGAQHAVVYKGTQPIYDSADKKEFIRGRPVWIFKLIKKRSKRHR